MQSDSLNSFGFEKRSQTLCWDCAKAIGECSWSKYGVNKPVEGWIAKPTSFKTKGINNVSYTVYQCPEFVRDADKNGLVKV